MPIDDRLSGHHPGNTRSNKIVLLKIDAEKSELDIHQGHRRPRLAENRSDRVEIHDPTREAIKRIENLLIEKG